MKEFVLPVLLVSSGCLPVLGQVLYDGSLGTAPAQQGWATVSLPLSLATPVADSAVRLDTLALSGELSGFSRTAPSPLDRTNGFCAVFTLRLHEESHNTPDRAGLSVIVLGHDKRGLELAFWADRVWAQSDAPLFKHAEEALRQYADEVAESRDRIEQQASELVLPGGRSRSPVSISAGTARVA